jgi:hypothetical protein
MHPQQWIVVPLKRRLNSSAQKQKIARPGSAGCNLSMAPPHIFETIPNPLSLPITTSEINRQTIAIIHFSVVNKIDGNVKAQSGYIVVVKKTFRLRDVFLRQHLCRHPFFGTLL